MFVFFFIINLFGPLEYKCIPLSSILLWQNGETVYIYGLQVIPTLPPPPPHFYFIYFLLWKIDFVLTDIADPDEMQNYAAFHLFKLYWRQQITPHSLSRISWRWCTKLNSHVRLIYVKVGRGWKMTLIWHAGFWSRHIGSMYTWRYYSSIAYDFNLNLHPVCAVDVLLNHEYILDQLFKQWWLRAITL